MQRSLIGMADVPLHILAMAYEFIKIEQGQAAFGEVLSENYIREYVAKCFQSIDTKSLNHFLNGRT